MRNESAVEARAYVIFSPGTEMERFVRAVAANPADVVALAAANGIEFTEPVSISTAARSSSM